MSSRSGPSRFPLGLDRLGQGAAPTTQRTTLRPQRPLHDAAADAQRLHSPEGMGLDSAAVRMGLVQRLRAQGLQCEPVCQALAQVPRHLFVDTALVTQAYEDTALPIGQGQTISKPSVVARMLSLLHAGPGVGQRGGLGRVLEVGTGCGYQTALLALLGTQVHSLERLKPLHEKARQNLVALRRHNLRLIYGDGRLGHAPHAPYDSIIAAAGGEDLPTAWLEQLAEGGRLVAPVHDGRAGGQTLVVVDRVQGQYLHQRHEAVHFVPLKSGLA